MIALLLSFFGSSIFRVLLGEVSGWFKERQEHANQMDLMRLQEEQQAAQHARNLESVRLQAELGQKEIALKSAAAVDEIQMSAWATAVAGTTKVVGISWVDAWNAAIRPALATWATIMVSLNYAGLIALDDAGWGLCGAAIGLFLGERISLKRGK
jgi:hypothetical protein